MAVDLTTKSPVGGILPPGEELCPNADAQASRRAGALKSQILQNAILGNSELAIVATDAEGVVQLFNAGAERMLGYAAAEVVNRIAPDDLYDPQEAIRHARSLSAEFATTIAPGLDALACKSSRGLEDKYELTCIRHDGSRCPAHVSITALRGDSAGVIGYLLILTDNTAAQAATIAMERERVAEEMFRQAIESCPSGMVLVDVAGRIVLVNGAIERMFDYPRSELIGQTIDFMVPGLLYAEFLQRRVAAMDEHHPSRVSAAHVPVGRRRDGSEFPVEVGLNPIHVGDESSVLRVIVDTSERVRVQRMKDEFVSTVSHELRTPMTSMAASLGLLAGQWSARPPDAASRLLEIAHQNSQRLVRLLNDILDIAKLESGGVVFNLRQIDVRLLLQRAIDDNRVFAESYGVMVRLDPGSAEGHIKGDSDRLIQVFTNLLSNAVKFSPAGQEVLLGVEKHGTHFRIAVSDHGAGIPVAFKPYIFDKFTQADGTDVRQRGGTGLGLSIVKQIVEQLGGNVGCGDAPGGGTIFHVDLPAWEAQPAGGMVAVP